ncbi:phage late control protein [Betaproteobacteria bacterium]|nr:phage late control protein [Betaproteobacteria bacterium]GHU29196.1 phage late control protein [Betaproteobacteria bacterium]
MKPTFQLLADSQDITDLLRDRLISLRITDKPGIESDECEITVDDRDGAVAFPRKGATLEISLGYEGQKLIFVGKYKVDEITVSGPPQQMVIRGKPADFAATLKSQRRHGWEDVTLADIVGDVARRNNLQPACEVEAQVPRADQINESDINFVTRIAGYHGATATIKNGKLIVATRGEGKTGSGRELPRLTLHRDDLASWTLTFPDRPMYSEAKAGYHDSTTGKLEVLAIENPGEPAGEEAPAHTDRHTYPNKPAAEAAAKRRVESLNRASASGSVELMRGRADVSAEQMLELVGIKDKVDGNYPIESVEQQFSKSAWVTSISINAGNEGKAKVGRGKDSAQKGEVLEIEGPQK